MLSRVLFDSPFVVVELTCAEELAMLLLMLWLAALDEDPVDGEHKIPAACNEVYGERKEKSEEFLKS